MTGRLNRFSLNVRRLFQNPKPSPFIYPQSIHRRQNHTSPDGPEDLSHLIARSSEHNDLTSFLSYTARVGLDTKSTVYVGTHYEYTVQAALRQLGVSTQRVGAANDRGIDLLGHWSLPLAPDPIRVFVQCKSISAKRAGPVLVRELEGGFRGLPVGWNESEIMGLLVTTAPGTKATREAMQRSDFSIVHLNYSTDGQLMHMSWNAAAASYGLDHASVGLVYMPDGTTQLKLHWKK